MFFLIAIYTSAKPCDVIIQWNCENNAQDVNLQKVGKNIHQFLTMTEKLRRLSRKMFNVLFLIWYFLTLIIMVIGVVVFKFFEDIKEIKKLNRENAFLKRRIEILKEDKKQMNDLNEILNETIFYNN